MPPKIADLPKGSRFGVPSSRVNWSERIVDAEALSGTGNVTFEVLVPGRAVEIVAAPGRNIKEFTGGRDKFAIAPLTTLNPK